MAELITSSGGQSLGIQGHVVPLVSEEEVRALVIAPGRVECAQSTHARINAIVGGRKSDDVIVNVLGGNGTRYVWSGGVLTELAHQQTIDQLVAMGAGAVNWELDEVERILAKQR
ncbi:hypothetical protein [Microbacterium sp. NPDC057944]|uniref:hypothetical protein n=1 Tax=Microbacterium sp. NPDC057944 TaxID=3346286 RepID=UPI0036DAD149